MKLWHQCDYCGRFIGLKEFEEGSAVRNLLTPDSHFTTEEYETFHKECEESNEQAIRQH